MRNSGLEEAQAGIKIAGRNINILRYGDDNTFMAESEEELKSLLMKVKEKSAKVGLKLNIQKTKIMESGPITSWQTNGETVETVTGFIFLGSKITADGDCSWEIKRHLLLGRKVMTNVDSILKSRDITLSTKVCLVKAMVFPVVIAWMWELDCEESWVLKNWCFWTVVLEKTLESPLDCKEIQSVQPKGDQSWVFIGGIEVEAETPILWPSHAKSWHWKRAWGWEGLGAGEGDDRGWDGWVASPTRWTWVWVNSGSWCRTGRPGVVRLTGWQRVGHDWATELNWTERATAVGNPYDTYDWKIKSRKWC